MRLLGITDLSQVHPKFLNTCDIDHLIPKSLESSFPEIGPSQLRAKL